MTIIMKKIFLLFAMLFAMCAQVSAQAIKGDMNDDYILDVADINELISTILGQQMVTHIDGMGNENYNVIVAGTWYDTPAKKFVLNADGTTDYPNAKTFKYIPGFRCILFFDEQGKPCGVFNDVSLKGGILVVTPFRSDVPIRFTSQPVQLVTSITLSSLELHMSRGEERLLTATVLPENASNKKVTWTVDNPNVARVANNVVYAVADGEAIITCTAADGSDVKATCKVVVGTRHEYVDLGLPSGVLWATCNIGAERPEDIGMYFAWGDIKGYAKSENHWFTWDYYKWCRGTETSMTKYCTNIGWGQPDLIVELLPEDDAATAIWGKEWRMPTEQDFSELCNSEYTTSMWTTVNGVKGRLITSMINGNSIFMPAGGRRYNAEIVFMEEKGNYWSSSLIYLLSAGAWFFDTDATKMTYGLEYRYMGMCVRPVRAVKAQ